MDQEVLYVTRSERGRRAQAVMDPAGLEGGLERQQDWKVAWRDSRAGRWPGETAGLDGGQERLQGWREASCQPSQSH